MPTSSSYKFVYVRFRVRVSLYRSQSAEAPKYTENSENKTTTFRRFFLTYLYVSLFRISLSGFCFSRQIASDIKFIYAKFALRALSYCPGTDPSPRPGPGPGDTLTEKPNRKRPMTAT